MAVPPPYIPQIRAYLVSFPLCLVFFFSVYCKVKDTKLKSVRIYLAVNFFMVSSGTRFTKL